LYVKDTLLALWRLKNIYCVEEHCFGCASALRDCADEYGYHIVHKAFTKLLGLRLKRYNQFRWKGSEAS